MKLEEIEEELDRTFRAECLYDGTHLAKEIYALENAVRAILDYLREKEIKSHTITGEVGSNMEQAGITGEE